MDQFCDIFSIDEGFASSIEGDRKKENFYLEDTVYCYGEYER